MAVIVSNSFDPYFNLATEEYFLRNDIIDEDLIFMWRSHQAFVFGRNQNPFIEINPDYFNKDIPIIRRISGGGTIYQDMNTLNFSYITKSFANKINDYEYFLKPIIDTLNKIGLNVEFKPKSHLFIQGLKISGNAQAFINNKLLHHGTLLYNSDLNIINDALVKFQTHAEGNHIISNKQLVGNLKDFLPNKYSLEDMNLLVLDSILKEKNIRPDKYILTEKDVSEINQLVTDKYKTWEWNFGKTRFFEMNILIKDNLEKISVDSGIITNINNSVYSRLLRSRYFSEEYFNILKSFENPTEEC
ncbi:MAG: biotin/lipoate A/B protein ligase family protein [Candidatus Izemoplasmatales bacterium]|nr:biotin/lipoate A/B protein ligase family protein [Candidatus Izemoplasmatales bacterium]